MAVTEYLFPYDLPKYYDLRRVLELANDLGDGGATEANLSNSASAPYQLIENMIRLVSSELDSAVQVGSRYARTDLETIISDLTDPVILADAELLKAAKKRAALLQGLVADLTFGRLMARRGYTAAAMIEQAPQVDQALKKVLDLSNGQRIFDLDDPKTSGRPQRDTLGANVTGALTPVRNSPLFGAFDSTFSPLYPIR